MPRPVALLTDFGADVYAGILRGVLLARLPDARVVDVTHAVPPQDVAAGALRLAAAVPFFPADTVFLAVVDPGVGGPRRPVVLGAGDHYFVGPDNGLLWPAAARAAGAGRPQAWVLDRPDAWLPEVSATFHGRDVFAPVAALLADGAAPETLGTPIADPVEWLPPPPVWTPDGVRGEVILVDGYGNAVTNLRPPDLGDPAPGTRQFRLAGHTLIGPAPHYAAAPLGAPLVVLGSFGTYEIAVNGGSAAAGLGVTVGAPVDVAEAA